MLPFFIGLQHHPEGKLRAEAEGSRLRENLGGTRATAVAIKTTGPDKLQLRVEKLGWHGLGWARHDLGW